ncbi:Leukotriene A-4 hydrolase [Liparis tanakae]|uniref:Leukotriene A-4 hydrolase n=1 Tax=Liparis tanakae TaxID=230148 RepID=A0A4Z2EQJ6_9TELE|nr:Leukotriene A-4 hydrolase [Liparis tanakae]
MTLWSCDPLVMWPGGAPCRLNEGHTVYLERMIGRSMVSEQFRQFKALGGWKDLQDSVNTFGSSSPLTQLVPSLQDVDPDDAFSSRFSYGSVTTDQWKEHLFSYFKDQVEVLNKVDWTAWMFTPGMPPVQPRYDTTLADACIALSQRWIKAGDQDLSRFQGSDLKTLSSHQLIEFLSLLLQEVDHQGPLH